MLCDNCTKATVCRLKEDCNRLERSISGNHVEDILSVEVKCKEHNLRDTLASKSPVKFPDMNKIPLGTNAPIKWGNPITCSNGKRIAFEDLGNGYVRRVEL